MLENLLLSSLLIFSPLKTSSTPLVPLAQEGEVVATTKTYTSVDSLYTLEINETDLTFTLVRENESYKGTYKVNALGEYELYINETEFLYKVKVDDTTMTFEIFKEISEEEAYNDVIEVINAWLEQYLTTDFIGQIINWAIDAGLITLVAGIYFKYRKYKAKSSEEIAKEVQNKITEILGSEFNKLSQEQINTILNRIDKFDDALKVFEQALVLAQDKTSEGKKALIEIITKNTKSEETKEVASKVETKIIEEQKQVENAKQEIQKDFTPID